MQYKDIEILRIVHACVQIKFDGLVIYIDPFTNSGSVDYYNKEKADYIFITHEHFDHCDNAAINQLKKESTMIFGNQKVKDALEEQSVIVVEPGKEYIDGKIKFNTIYSYNLNKYREPGIVYHPKSESGIGFVLQLGESKIYHTGDSDFIPEMQGIENLDVILVPVSGTYVMTPQEASQLVGSIQPKIAIPIHYGAIVGSEIEAELFDDLCSNMKAEVKII